MRRSREVAGKQSLSFTPTWPLQHGPVTLLRNQYTCQFRETGETGETGDCTPSDVKNHCKSCLCSSTSIFTCRITSCLAPSDSPLAGLFGGHLGTVSFKNVSNAGAQYSWKEYFLRCKSRAAANMGED